MVFILFSNQYISNTQRIHCVMHEICQNNWLGRLWIESQAASRQSQEMLRRGSIKAEFVPLLADTG